MSDNVGFFLLIIGAVLLLVSSVKGFEAIDIWKLGWGLVVLGFIFN